MSPVSCDRFRRRRPTWLAAAASLAVALSGCADGRAAARADAAQARDTSFAGLVAWLSEPGGFFDTDNLISNERSYLHVTGALERLGVRGGAYLGVGPDQNFSYIARVRPEVAFIIDIRRDNMLHQLLFKALFASARNRVEFLALLFGVQAPADPAEWDRRTIGELVEYIDAAPRVPDGGAALVADVRQAVRSYGVPLSDADLETVATFHRTFISAGLGLRFNSFNRRPQPYYPTYRQLVLEVDLDGRQRSYLADENDFQFVKALEARDRVIPVVGDLAGPHAVRAVAGYLEARGIPVSAVYTSNVEFYLWGDGTFGGFGDNMAALPRDARSVIIRSYFGRGFRREHPLNEPGYYSTQLLQPLEGFVRTHAASGYRSYWELVTNDALPLRSPRAPGG